MYVIQSNISTNDATKPFLYRDELIKDDNNGVKLLFDFGFGWSYPAGNLPRPLIQNPINGSLVRDMSNAKRDGVVDLPSGLGITMTHDGHSIVKNKGAQYNYSVVNAPNVLSSFTGSTEYIVCAYVKVAGLADWNAAGSSIASFISAADYGKTYANGSELVLIATAPKLADGTSGEITARFQTAIGSMVVLTIRLPTGLNLYSTDLVQIAAWVSNGKCNLRIKSNLFEQTASAAYAGNSATVSANSIGFETGKGQFGGASVPHKLYRGFVENLDISGRDPVEVIDADFVRSVARIGV